MAQRDARGAVGARSHTSDSASKALEQASRTPVSPLSTSRPLRARTVLASLIARRPWYNSASDASASADWRLTSSFSMPSSPTRIGTSCSRSESAFTLFSWLERSVLSVVSV